MCGVVGVIGPNNEDQAWAAYETYRALLTLQHRGQDGCGILSYDQNLDKLRTKKGLGLVANVFSKENLDKLGGNMAIGHTRYSTIGTHEEDDLQPIVSGASYGVGMAHNGNIVNKTKIKQLLEERYNQRLLTDNDLELLIALWTVHLSHGRDFSFESMTNAVFEMSEVLVGAYSVVGIVAGKGLFGFKDPSGIRPLMLGVKEIEGKKAYCLSSETHALTFLGYEYLRDLAPSEFVFIDTDGNLKSTIIKTRIASPCMFEWVYFSSAEGSILGQSVYGARLKLGIALANSIPPDVAKRYDIVVPIPDTARPAAIALSEKLGIPYREALIKNRYIQRSFILGSQAKREDALLLKLSPVISEIKGKKILLVDDSIVRGTTSKRIITLLKKYGAAQVGVASTCPPIGNPCYYGIDFPTHKELIASKRDEREIAKELGIEELFYLKLDELAAAIGVENVCQACLDGEYPTSTKDAPEFCKRRDEL